MRSLSSYIGEVEGGLRGASAADASGRPLGVDAALNAWAERARQAHDVRGTLFFCGNGASATMAEHMSHDCFQNAGLLTYTVSETAHITAISNDISYEQVFAYRIARMCGDTDMLIAISSSGKSPNIAKAVEAARAKGMFVVTVSGMSPGNDLRKSGDLNFHVALGTYGLVESAHAVLLHCWLDLYLEKYKGGRH
jgi:D-sedoheptulose 7-phosphate isomerase